MNKTILIIFFAIIFILVVLFAFVAGVSFQMKKDSPKLETGQKNEITLQKLSSKLIHSIDAYGQVKNISGRDVTLSSGTDNLTVRISNDAKILFYIAPEGSKQSSTQKAGFEDIKKDFMVNININILSDGSLESSSVIIFLTYPK